MAVVVEIHRRQVFARTQGRVRVRVSDGTIVSRIGTRHRVYGRRRMRRR